MKFPEPLILIVKEDMIYHELKVPEKDSKEELMAIIEEKNNNYVITNDNFKKDGFISL